MTVLESFLAAWLPRDRAEASLALVGAGLSLLSFIAIYVRDNLPEKGDLGWFAGVLAVVPAVCPLGARRAR